MFTIILLTARSIFAMIVKQTNRSIIFLREEFPLKRDEKNLQSRQKILDSALQEFGERSYGEASMNSICSVGNISKGIIYHYFSDKDALYLACVKDCFDALVAHLKSHITVNSEDIEVDLCRYFETRIEFFEQNPVFLKLFYSAVSAPPKHLLSQIATAKAEFDELNIAVLTTLLGKLKLRPDVTVEQIIEAFLLYQDMVNTRYQMQSIDSMSLEEHDRRCSHALNILLYGVVYRGEMTL